MKSLTAKPCSGSEADCVFRYYVLLSCAFVDPDLHDTTLSIITMSLVEAPLTLPVRWAESSLNSELYTGLTFIIIFLILFQTFQISIYILFHPFHPYTVTVYMSLQGNYYILVT